MSELVALAALVVIVLSLAAFLICRPRTVAEYATDLAKFWGTILVLAASTALVVVIFVYVVSWLLPPII